MDCNGYRDNLNGITENTYHTPLLLPLHASSPIALTKEIKGQVLKWSHVNKGYFILLLCDN